MVSLFRRLFQKSVKPAPAISGSGEFSHSMPQDGVRSGPKAAVVATGPVRRPLAAGGATPLFRLSEVTMERAAVTGRTVSAGAFPDRASVTDPDHQLEHGGSAQGRGTGAKREDDFHSTPAPEFPLPAAAQEEDAVSERQEGLKENAPPGQAAGHAEAVKLPLLPPVTPIQPIAIKPPPVAAAAPVTVAMPLRAALRDADAGQLGFHPAEIPDGVVLNLPLALVRPQLAGGKVEIGLEDLRQGVLEANRPAFDRAAPELRVVVPLSELFPLLPMDVIPVAGEWEGGTENAALSGSFDGPPWPADDQDFMTSFRDPAGGLPDNSSLLPSPPPSPPPSAEEASRRVREPIPAAPLLKAATVSCPVPPAISLPPASLPPAPMAAAPAPTPAPNFPALPPLVRRNAGMFSRPPGSSPLPPAVQHADGIAGEIAGNLPRIPPLPLLSKAPALPSIPAPPAATALSTPLPLPVPLPTEIPAPLPTLTVLTDCGNLPWDDDDLGQPYPAGALTVEPPFPGRIAGPKAASARQVPVESPAAETLPPGDSGNLQTTVSPEPSPETLEPLEPGASASASASASATPPPANPAALPGLPALPALAPLQVGDVPTSAPSLPTLPELKLASASAPSPAASPLPGGDLEDLSFGCVTDSSQLTLRAIFGTDQRMTPQHVIGHCARLPGLRACVLLRRDSAPLHSEGLTEAETETFVRRAAQSSELILALSGSGNGGARTQAGGGGNSNFTLRSDGGVQSFFLAEDLCLTVWHRETAFSAGIREKLILAARELAKLDF